MELKQAEEIALRVKAHLEPACQHIEIVGSIRRRRPFVHDLDFVLIPSNQGQLYSELMKMGQVKICGQKLLRCRLTAGIDVDVYVATEETWATLMLIRTGSMENNIRLCSRAKELGWKLHADGSGLVNESGKKIAGDTEISIYNVLGLPYQKPEERN